MVIAPPAPTQTASLFVAGHLAALSQRGEIVQGNPIPTFGNVQVDAVLSEVTESDVAMEGGLYHKGDYRVAVAKIPFSRRPKKGDPCRVRGLDFVVKDPVIEKTATYQLAIGRSVR